MKPVVDRLRKEFEGKVDVRVENTATDPEAQELAGRMGVKYVPTFMFFTGEGKKVDQVVGGLSEQQLRQKIEALLD